MIPVGWLAPSADCWDSNMLRLLLDGELYPHGLKVRHHAGYPNTDTPVVIVVPGRYYAQHTDQINQAIKRFVSVLMVVTSDEESCFDVGEIEHKAIRFWVQTPTTGREYGDARFIGVGFSPTFNGLPVEPPPKALDVFMSGQNTHDRRRQCFAALKGDLPGVSLVFVNETEGFTQGLDADTYMQQMRYAKVAPAPSGAVSPDSFRLWEALEAHAVPIADDVSPVYDSAGFWELVCPGAPFPVLTDYNDLPGYIEDVLKDWPANANRVAAWWMQYKRTLVRNLCDDLKTLGAIE